MKRGRDGSSAEGEKKISDWGGDIETNPVPNNNCKDPVTHEARRCFFSPQLQANVQQLGRAPGNVGAVAGGLVVTGQRWA